MSAKASIPHGALAQNLLATVDAYDAPNEPERAADASEGPPPPPADQMATASDSAMESAPAPMESDEEQDDESVPEVPGTTI